MAELGRPWGRLTDDERLDIVLIEMPVSPLSESVIAAVREYFETRSTESVDLILNVSLRETWREGIGDTAAWDAAARERVLEGLMDPAVVPDGVLWIGAFG